MSKIGKREFKQFTVHEQKTEDSIKMVLAERGYAVVAIKPGYGECYFVGQVIFQCCGHDFGQPFQVISKTDHEDWIAQNVLIEEKLGFKMPPPARIERGDAYYRVFTD